MLNNILNNMAYQIPKAVSIIKVRYKYESYLIEPSQLYQ